MARGGVVRLPSFIDVPPSTETDREGGRSCFGKYGRTAYGGNPIVQQTLPSTFFYIAPQYVIPLFFAVSFVFIPISITLFITCNGHYEVRGNYQHIHKYQYIPSDPKVNINEGIRSFYVGNEVHRQGTRTRVSFKLEKPMKKPVYLYYTLGNFHQNFRAFHEGRSLDMLRGHRSIIGSYPECQPYERPGTINKAEKTEVKVVVDGGNVTLKYEEFLYNPCGIAPWSMFNDTFVLYRSRDVSSAQNDSVKLDEGAELICNTSDFGPTGEPLYQSKTPNKCKKKGISWPADEKIRFRPLERDKKLWSLRYPHKNDNVYLTNGWYADEPGHRLTDPEDYDMQVWIRAAFLSNFSKLFRIIDEDLREGNYFLDIEEFFDVTTFHGTKGYLLRTSSMFGRSGTLFAATFLIVGSVAFVVGVAFAIQYCMAKKGLGNSLPQPKASWYTFNRTGLDIQNYFQLRTKRYEICPQSSDDE
ncbi:hypothetical protein, conserved [Trypanosoma brucei gambiense DAL972]|uniref:LEM3 (Ligand-effect modulator 3) family / CDC50 family n=1 Tax=Trypanosoma brucei gambiense (strain MHOM/CI/86/DAL972) TaxID=679716 RepID=D0A9K3_TRYB9|nr:hypothetical protein, conserved [Trypanosoma brucei gambiense DAL972]CBH18354.1 hypothetical protein, conserved [Trypanosoma brucei gambiense DAL972]|eukprot:XP_011780618.1 hypothetical protein, conserved [Trypanosoma brucei gambiense DAL972]